MSFETLFGGPDRGSRSAQTAGSGMSTAGALLMVAGVAGAAIAFAYNVSVDVGLESSSVANIDKISIREMILWCSGFTFISGTILLAVGRACTMFSAAVATELNDPNPASGLEM